MRLLLLVCFALAIASRATAAAPNILFLLSDDHSYPFLSCYGSPNVRTPALDRLAAEGMKFHRFFTAAPQCVQSRAAFLTGRSPVAARMMRFSSPLPRDEVTFLELLRAQAGYFTGIAGRTYHLDGALPAGSALQATLAQHRLQTFAERVDYLRTGSDREAVAQMAEFLRLRPAGKPFCLWLNFSDPHTPWNAPAEFRPDPRSLVLPPYWPDLPGVREQLADHAAEINRLDRTVAAVLALLEEHDLAGNTLVVFAGDNGVALPRGKGSLHDPGANVPFVLRWPGVVRPGGESRALLSAEDLAPTLLAAAALPPGDRMSGRSFLPLLRGQPYTPNSHIFIARGPHADAHAPLASGTKSSVYDLGRAIRTDRYKLIYNCTPGMPYGPVDTGGGSAWREISAAHVAGTLAAPLSRAFFSLPRPVYELYDLESDPAELNNLSGAPELREIERELRLQLSQRMILDFDSLPLPGLSSEPVRGPRPATARPR